MIIRPAEPRDAPAITAIWNHYIRETIATFNSHPKAVEEVAALMSRDAFLVADDGAVTGFATYHQFRSGVGYRFAAEHTIYLAPDRGGAGVGRALMSQLEAHAYRAGFRVMVAGITGENADGIAFHRAMGFENPCRMPEMGFKFDRWHDLVFMQKKLTEGN